MTTNHRPTFESRRGRDTDHTSVVHARALPGHKELKYRGEEGIDEKDAKAKYNELKQELLQREEEHYKKVKGSEFIYNDRHLIEGKESIENKYEEDITQTSSENKERNLESEGKHSGDASGDRDGTTTSINEESNTDEASDVDSSSEDEEDEEELLRELEKIKRERQEAKLQKEIQKNQDSALAGNPLLNPNKPIRKSWRQDRVFKRQNSGIKKSKENEYINNMVRSSMHKDFMDRFIR